MKLVLCMVLICLAFSQRKVIINTIPDNTPAYLLEMELIKNTFKLYNLDNKVKLEYSINNVDVFMDLFEILEKAKDPHNIISVYQITITKERQEKYLFSSPYLPIKESVYTLRENNDLNYKRKGARIAIQTNSTQEKQITLLSKYGVVRVDASSVGEKMTLLRDKNADFVIGDNIEIWGNTTYKLVEDCEIQPGSGFGLVFPLKSNLRDALEPYLERYLKSKTYYNFLFKKYGTDVAKYYRKNMKFNKNK